ncbi:MAG: hypothetical protein A2W93_13720 [Bacteroidetes bacterium GWF2_43_63]|nr:MAG: hypothetical protein A2W94_03915 [Bacteroidetes bacterium GWE2_42_42]OFY55047.1 MAG: hypothetical protein A2W93_13720 [Bacteroidetes bacterium GWF2_43_63]HBG69584.1 hypothetical protein [Bacteroidales bacterium]HCB60677.1 hypothetical protein [Bacteroidales bacterium]HCY24019.1 hypothetical protein [Bacteroidales bacterium]
MNTKFLLFFFIAILNASLTQAQQDIKVRIHSDKSVHSLDLIVFSGTYQLQDTAGNTVKLFNKGDSLHIAPFNYDLVIFTKTDTIFCGKQLILRSVGFLNIFQLTTGKSTRLYDDDLIVSLRIDKSLWLLNEVKLEHYVAGVVQSEAGIAKNNEFYKVQAVAARTYTLKNIEKHAAEDYQMCDQTCCQVYKGRCANTEIMIATSQTAGEIIIDSTSKQLIIAVFHSNSGGQTCNSEDVWGRPLPYLRSVNDPYSVSQTSYSWQKSMPRSEWLDYLKRNFNYPISDPSSAAKVTSFTQANRQVYLTGNIGLRKVREDLKLRSTFFSIKEDGSNVVFTGRGFGHGVGLSQEGAINMARQGFSYTDILKFYYLGTEITTIESLSTSE